MLTGQIELGAAFDGPPDDRQGALVDFGGAGNLPGDSVGEAVQSQQLAVRQTGRAVARKQLGDRVVDGPVDRPASFLDGRQHNSVAD